MPKAVNTSQTITPPDDGWEDRISTILAELLWSILKNQQADEEQQDIDIQIIKKRPNKRE